MKLVVTQTDTLAQVTVRVQGLVPMPPATSAALGAVIIGAGLMIAADGTLSAPSLAIAMGLTATGSVQADALPLTAGVNVFSAVPAGAGCVLDATRAENAQTVATKCGSDLLVYPPGGAQIDLGGAGVAVIVGPNQRVQFVTRSASISWSAA